MILYAWWRVFAAILCGFYERTSALGKRSFFVLQGEFTGWALPKLLETQATLSDEIDPKIWSETLSAVSKDEKKENIE